MGRGGCLTEVRIWDFLCRGGVQKSWECCTIWLWETLWPSPAGPPPACQSKNSIKYVRTNHKAGTFLACQSKNDMKNAEQKYSRPANLKNDMKYVMTNQQSWALALYFQVCSPLSNHFISMDRYCSSAHLTNFQVRSSFNRSKKNSGSLSVRALKRKIAPKTTAFRSYVWIGTYICT